MKKILVVLLIAFCSNVYSQRLVPVYGLEGGFLAGGLSNMSGYTQNFWFNGSFWADFVGTNKYGKPTVGFKIKLNYNYYEMDDNGNGGGNISIGETTIPLLFKVCLSSATKNWVEKKDGENEYYSMRKDLFLFVGPQVGFPKISGGSNKTYMQTDYSVVAGGELYLNNSIYIALYEQTGLSNIYPSQPNVRLGGFTAAFGFRLL